MPTRDRYVLSLNGKEEVTKGGKGERERDRRRNGTIEATAGKAVRFKAQVVKTAKVDV